MGSERRAGCGEGTLLRARGTEDPDQLGAFFVLTGKEIGQFYSFTETTMAAIGIDAGAGLELGRVDISGDESKFMHEYFYGYREKGWMSATAPVYGVVGISGAIAVSISNYNGTTVQAVSFGLSVGLGLPFILGGGWNQGVISK